MTNFRWAMRVVLSSHLGLRRDPCACAVHTNSTTYIPVTVRTMLITLFFVLTICPLSVFAESTVAGESWRRAAAEIPPVYETSGFFPMRVGLQWLPQSQFAGFYMALEKGFYREAGFDVVLIHAGPGPSSLDFLLQKKVDVATLFLADALIQEREHHPLTNVGQFVQRSNLMLVAWKDHGITTAADLDGKRVMHWPGVFSVSFAAFFAQMGVTPSQIIPQPSNVNLFLRKAVSACAAMSYNELNRIYQAGVDMEQLTLFPMHEFGLGFPEDGLYAEAAYARAHPEELLKFRDLTMKGWEYARQHPEETIDVVLRWSHEAGVPANRSHAQWMLAQLLTAIFVETEPASTSAWDETTSTSVEAESTSTSVEAEPVAALAGVESPAAKAVRAVSSAVSHGRLSFDSFNRTVNALIKAGKLRRKIDYADFILAPEQSAE